MSTTGSFKRIHEVSGLDSLIELDQKFFPNPWTRAQWTELPFSQHLLFSWKIDKGFALFGHLAGDDTAHLYKILIHPAERGTDEIKGFWSSILAELRASGVKNIYLEVESDNLRAIGFYQKVGFQILRKVKGYYSSGGDALMMSLTL